MLNLVNRSQIAVLLAGLWAIALTALPASAQTTLDPQSVTRADNFLRTAQRGKNVLSYVHFGAQYREHFYQSTRGVNNRPGHFGLVYRYKWENDGITDIAFLCDARGNVYEVQILYSNAQFQQPYALANASIRIVGNLVLDAFRNQMTNDEIQQTQRFIDTQNARGLLEMSLRLQQALGQ